MVTNGDGDDQPDRTLHVRFRTGDDERLEDALEALDEGENPDPVLEVVYHDPAEVAGVTENRGESPAL
jgi:hypothetical protein